MCNQTRVNGGNNYKYPGQHWASQVCLRWIEIRKGISAPLLFQLSVSIHQSNQVSARSMGKGSTRPVLQMIIHALQTVLHVNKKYAFPNCLMYKYRVLVLKIGYCIRGICTWDKYFFSLLYRVSHDMTWQLMNSLKCLLP